ncbi:MAG: uroporphyrinogen-III C-methyltransferase, partial [Myxococcota bacterium]
MTTASGTVYLVGAGPGDPGLITRRGAELLGLADVVVYDGLVNPILLDLVSDEAERIYAGKKRAAGGAPMTQDAINHLLVERASAGRRVVRLKGGDPFVFGRGPDECRALVAAGIRFEIVPGVTSAIGATAYAGIPLTARGASSTVAFATGHEAAGKPSSDIDWQGLARAGTVVLFMA